MMYIQLSLPYREYDKVIIKAFHLYETSIGVSYVVKNNTNILFEKSFIIGSDNPKYNEIISKIPTNSFSIIENLHKVLLDYMIENNIETGTLEVK